MKIEKGIPIPNKCKYPFGEMEVGDSIFFSEGSDVAVRSAASIYGSRTNKKFAFRKMDSGFRVWRTK